LCACRADKFFARLQISKQLKKFKQNVALKLVVTSFVGNLNFIAYVSNVGAPSIEIFKK
jgi:hypothetical protein